MNVSLPRKHARETGEMFYIDGKGVERYTRTAHPKDHSSKWRSNNPAKAHECDRNKRLKFTYGITPEQYNTMLDSQGFACAICREVPEDPSGKAKTLHVDHCHKSGKTRALLCGNCNKGLGHFKDRVDLLLAAAKYLSDLPTDKAA